MSGIARIQELRVDSRPQSSRTVVPNQEIWFKDGDQAFVTSLATGESDDKYLDEIEMYTFRNGTKFANLLKDDDVDVSMVPQDTRPSHKFAFWAYVHEIIHSDKRQDDWEPIEGPGNRKLFKETVNDFKILTLSFGANNINWNQLVDIYGDSSSLDKTVTRIKRRGASLDTTYTITATTGDFEIPEDKKAEITNLTPIKEYVTQRYGKIESSDTSVPEDSVAVNDDDDMPF